MTDPASIDPTRRSALSLLADGNGVESVAHVLDVPVDVVAAWQRGEHVAWPAVEATTPSTATAHVPVPASHVHIHDVDVLHAAPAGELQLSLVAGLFIVALALTSGIAIALLHRPDVFSEMWLACVPLAATGISLALQARVRFVFGETEMVEQCAWSARRLAYADVERTTVEAATVSAGKGARTKGLRVTIASRFHDASSLSLFIADTGPKPRDVIAHVRALPGATAAELALLDRPRLAEPAPGLVGVAVVIGMAIMGCCFALKDPDVSWSGIVHGLPRFEDLDRVDGVLVRATECPARKPFVQDVTLRLDGGGTVSRAIPCVLDADPLVDKRSHVMTIHSDRFGRAYRVVLDGQPLLRYGAVKAQDLAWRAFRGWIALLLIAVPVLLMRAFWRQVNDSRD